MGRGGEGETGRRGEWESGGGGEWERGRAGEACDYFFECSQESKPGQTKTRHSKEIKTK